MLLLKVSLCLMMQLELSLLMLLEELSFRASPFRCWMRLFLLFGQCLAQSSLVELSGESNLGAPAYTLTVVAAKTSKGMITKSDCFSALSHPLNQDRCSLFLIIVLALALALRLVISVNIG